jgi:hypothetical protein
MFSFQVLEQDEDVVELTITGPQGTITVITGWQVANDTLTLDGLHLDGSGPGVFGPTALLAMAKELGRHVGVRVVIIHGAVRTTGANPGHRPREIRILVESER